MSAMCVPQVNCLEKRNAKRRPKPKKENLALLLNSVRFRHPWILALVTDLPRLDRIDWVNQHQHLKNQAVPDPDEQNQLYRHKDEQRTPES